MRAMLLDKVVDLSSEMRPLRLAEVRLADPAQDEVEIRVVACAVCHTDLDIIEGRSPPTRFPMILGHQVIARVARCGRDVRSHEEGDLVGVGWIAHSCGGPRENLSDEFLATGRDVYGGFAESMLVKAQYAYRLPEMFENPSLASVLCAGVVGFRALRLCELKDDAVLGFSGFGSSARFVLQFVKHLYPHATTIVLNRGERGREQAKGLGADYVADFDAEELPLCDAVIDTTPVWEPVLKSLELLRPGGRLVINAIRKLESDKHCLEQLSYERHLWMEKELKSVANVTREDFTECLELVSDMKLVSEAQFFALERANEAVREAFLGNTESSKVLVPGLTS